jgi:DNA-directed RNA polymerase specialized sigma24 family protein
MTEKEMILGCIKEDKTSQRALYNLYYEKMFSVCLENSKNDRVAQESVIEGFVFVFDNIKKFKGGSLERWIKDIMIKETKKQNSKFSWNLADWWGRKEQVQMTDTQKYARTQPYK